MARILRLVALILRAGSVSVSARSERLEGP
jgi:hypothetical protein